MSCFNEHFNKVNFTPNLVLAKEYVQCVFTACDFAAISLSSIVFESCEFVECNFSIVPVVQTAFRDVSFVKCKLTGVRFEDCNTFGLSFNMLDCNATHTSFFRLKLKKSVFTNIQFFESDFSESDFTESVFDMCDFSGAVFYQTRLEKSDFRTSRDFIIDPTKNNVKKARFSLLGLKGLVHAFHIMVD